ncbi:hypothetical protein PIROE2DRAFT_17696 [Piromyces sp. E2]|nr:hypothetical protein PIROE2DRAFT_17696 [Piromyces sp. E2]|eukprot:OUM57355.1 hypothetical protein PIROE2DRAFT_17696 [Piromyces sp. E2]
MVISNIPAYQVLLSIQDTLSECSSSKKLPKELQRIVTIGIQSAGKSSVIENISEIELPRNTGIGTKAPLQIRLRKATSDDEYCRIRYGDETDEQWENFSINQTNEYIRKYQDNLFKDKDKYYDKNTELTNSLIVLEVYKKSSCDLTIIDLPGITHVNRETEEMVKNIVIEYIKNPRTIVLFAHNATTDFVSDECINLIKSVSENDDNRDTNDDNNVLKRIIPVLTKIDLATTEELIGNIEDCKKYKFGYSPILVKNSNKGNNSSVGERDNNNDDANSLTNYSEERKNEEEIINKHLSNQKLKDLCSDHQGINGLIEKLVEIQSLHLFNSKDKFQNIIKKTLKDNVNEMNNLPKIINDKEEFIVMITELDNSFKKLLLNKFETPNNLLPEENFDEKKFKFSLESQIRQKFEKFKDELNKKFLIYLTPKYYKQIKCIRSDSQGLKFKDFCGEKIIYDILDRCLGKYFEEFNDLIDEINSDICKVIDEVFCLTFEKYKSAFKKFFEISQSKFNEMKSKNLEKCNFFLEIMKENETNALCTFNENYINISKLIFTELEKKIKKRQLGKETDNIKDDDREEIEDNGVDDEELIYKLKDGLVKKDNPNIEEQFFKKFTGLTLDYIKGLGSKLRNYENKQKNEVVDWDSIKIMCSIYSYLKIFMDRMLDSIYKNVDSNFLKPFKNRIFFVNLKDHFLLMKEDELKPIMLVNDDTRKKIDKLSTNIIKLKKAKNDLNFFNKSMIF